MPLQETQIMHGFPTGFRGGLWVPINPPVRLLDTRAGQIALITPGAQLTLLTTYTYKATSPVSATPFATVMQAYSGIPSDAIGLVITLVGLNAVGGNGFLTIWPADAPVQPTASSANYNTAAAPAVITPNTVTVGLSASGEIKVYSSRTVDCILDIGGYFIPA